MRQQQQEMQMVSFETGQMAAVPAVAQHESGASPSTTMPRLQQIRQMPLFDPLRCCIRAGFTFVIILVIKKIIDYVIYPLLVPDNLAFQFPGEQKPHPGSCVSVGPV